MSADPPKGDLVPLPPEVRDEIVADLASSIEPALPEGVANRAAVAESAAATALEQFMEKGALSVETREESSFSMLHVGPVPPVPMVRGYEEIYPGAAKQMFDMAARDQEAFIASRADRARRDDRFRIISLVIGFLALLALLGASFAAGIYEHENVAYGMLALGVGGIIATFVGAPGIIPGRGKPTPDPATPRSTPPQIEGRKPDEE